MVYRYNGNGEKVYNSFRNDGSFLETFKKLQEAQQKQKENEDNQTVDSNTSQPSTSEREPSDKKAPAKPLPFVGKRRGGRVLPTGKVKKFKTDQDDGEAPPKDAWSLYLAEVKRYRDTTCEEDGKTRPLVK